MARGGATATADEPHPGASKAQSVIGEVIGGRHIEKTVIDARGETGIGLGREKGWYGAHRLCLLLERLNHLLHHVQRRRRPDTAICAHYVNIQLVEDCRDSCG